VSVRTTKRRSRSVLWPFGRFGWTALGELIVALLAGMSPVQKLLIGTWRSDRRRTLQTCHRYHCLFGVKKRRVGDLFGKLELRYTYKYVHHRLGDFEYRARYDVVAEDAGCL
jgi:hypothetical protein